eukprot:2575495-Alexandrium_andersonii.AAC.1
MPEALGVAGVEFLHRAGPPVARGGDADVELPGRREGIRDSGRCSAIKFGDDLSLGVMAALQ